MLISREAVEDKLREQLDLGIVTIHSSSFIDNEIRKNNIEGQWSLVEFLSEGANLSVEEENLLNRFDFSTVYTSNYHYADCEDLLVSIIDNHSGQSREVQKDFYSDMLERIEGEDLEKREVEKIAMLSDDILNLLLNTIELIDLKNI